MSKEIEKKTGFDSPQDAEQAMVSFINSNIRLRKVISGFIDFALFCVPTALIIRIVMKIYEKTGNGTGTEGFKAIFDRPLFAAILIIIFMLKDTIRSPGKRMMRLKLVNSDGSRPSLWKRVLRNVTVPVAQLEAIVLIFSGRRIADWVLGLEVADAEEATDGEK